MSFFVSGYQDSNLGPPAPKAGALTGLRYTPNAYCCCKSGAKLQHFFVLTSFLAKKNRKKVFFFFLRHFLCSKSLVYKQYLLILYVCF